jgi:hypothetical protein
VNPDDVLLFKVLLALMYATIFCLAIKIVQWSVWGPGPEPWKVCYGSCVAKHRLSCAFPYRAAFYSLSRCADQWALLLADTDKWNQIADIFAGKIRAVIQEENASKAAAELRKVETAAEAAEAEAMTRKAAFERARLALALCLVLSWLLLVAASRVEDETELVNLAVSLGAINVSIAITAADVLQDLVVADVAVKVARSALEAAKDVGQGQQQQ